MTFDIGFTRTAADHLRALRKADQTKIFDAIEAQLRHDARTETRNRKRLSENELADWKLRVEDFRVFYDVAEEGDRQTVKIKAIGHKVHNTLFVGGKEMKL
jgi:mRNA-degrading endonuclease RelE of RelBE toxin-antitoxin system